MTALDGGRSGLSPLLINKLQERDMTKKEASQITNCVIVARPGATKSLFSFQPGDEGYAIVDLERYLICPLEVFSDSVLEGFLKRYRETHTSAGQMTLCSVDFKREDESRSR